MRNSHVLCSVLALLVAACGSPGAEQATPSTEAQRRDTVFDPMTSTIGRAQGVQQTLDEQAAEQRRRIEESER